jgi:hypothetical protein
MQRSDLKLKIVLRTFAIALLGCLTAEAAVPLNCPAGVPLGDVRLRVEGDPNKEHLALRSINRLGEGDTVYYFPVKLRLKPKGGKVALVVTPAPVKPGDPLPKELPTVKVLQAIDADKPGHWKMPFRVGVAALVYGPEGLDPKRVKAFLSTDDDLIVQLADYAEKTAQAESLISAISNGSPLNPTQVDAALNGMGTQAGVGAVDRTLPKDQQLAIMLGRMNPALAGVDPVAPDLTVRTQAAASVITAVAGIFLGSPVGLAAGGTLLAMNLRTMMFPGTEFRSSFAQLNSAQGDDLNLCGKREPPRPRTKIAYLWAARIPNARAPVLTVGTVDHLPQGHAGTLSFNGDEHLVDRARNWKLVDLATKKEFPVKVHSVAGQKALEVNLSESKAEPGVYRLEAQWDWDHLAVTGAVYVSPLDNLSKARITPETQDQIREERGRTVIEAEGADFEFIQKVAVQRAGDPFHAPVPVPFSLPQGVGRGPQERLSIELDTKPLTAGDYTLFLTAVGGITREVPLKVLSPGPRIENAPLDITLSQEWQPVTLRGENLGQIEKLQSRDATFELGPMVGNQRTARVRLSAAAKEGQVTDLLAFAQDVSKPAVMPGAVRVKGPAPRILSAKTSLPPQNNIPLKDGELPAGGFVSVSLAVKNAGPDAKVRLRCAKSSEGEIALRVGEKSDSGSAQALSADELFLSFDPGGWQAGCDVSAVLDNGGSGRSKPFVLGKVIRVPHVDAFELTEEKNGENYIGKLIGMDLENIAQVGWAADHGIPVSGLPIPIGGDSRKQALKIELPWPAPSPHAALFIWFRGETAGRETRIKY